MYLQVHIEVQINLQTWLDVFQVLFWKLVVLEWPMKTLLVLIPNDCELCIVLFQHQILWFYELSKFHSELLFIDLPKNTSKSNGFLAVKFLPKYLPKIIWLFSHEEKSLQDLIFTRYTVPSLAQTWPQSWSLDIGSGLGSSEYIKMHGPTSRENFWFFVMTHNLWVMGKACLYNDYC